MAETMKTVLGDRNVVIQRGAGRTRTIWLELEYGPDEPLPGTTCLALTPSEATMVGQLLMGEARKIWDEEQVGMPAY